MTLRNWFSSTLPESSTCPVHDPPFRPETSCAASSRQGTPLARSKSITELLTGAFIWISRQMQRASNRMGKSGGHAQGTVRLMVEKLVTDFLLTRRGEM